MFTVLSDNDLALVEDVIPEVTETVTVRRTECVSGDVEQLLDYVAEQIHKLHGPFPRDQKREIAIIRSFMARWGEKASAIAHHAFEVEHGIWRSSPISIARFDKGSDPYFAQVIAERL